MPYYRAAQSPKAGFQQLALLTVIAFVTLAGAGCSTAEDDSIVPAPAPVAPVEQSGTPANPAPVVVTTTSTQAQTTPVSPNTATVASVYKDGVYTAEGAYQSPAGPESVKVTVTLKSDVVTDASVVGEAVAQISQRKQADFIENFKPQVIGKKSLTFI